MLVSVLVPTLGRPSLACTLASIAGKDAEVVVVGDGHQPSAEAAFAASGLPGCYCYTSPLHCWGGPQRDFGVHAAKGLWLMAMDDDDCYTEGAFDVVVSALSCAPLDAVHAWAMVYKDGRVLRCSDPPVLGGVSTQMLAWPNVDGRIGRWGRRYEGDYDFLVDTLARNSGKLVLHPEVIAEYGR